MANLKRRPDSDLNHENWDEEDPPEEQGEFRRANEEDLRGRRILKPRRKITAGTGGGGGPAVGSNPFSGFAFGGVSGSMPSFSLGIPAATATASGIGISSAEAGSTGSLFKLAGITPCAEPPTKASADSSTADAPGGGGDEPEAKSISESDGVVTEESSNSSSLPWNVSSRQDNEVGSEDGRGGADSRQSETLPSNVQQDSSNDHPSAQPTHNQSVPTSTAPPDSSESSSSLAPIPSSATNNRFSSFTFGSSFATSESEESSARVSSFQPFASAAVGDVASSSSAVAAPAIQQSPTPGDPRSPESSGIHLVRSSLEDDSADYENDTTSSSNKLLLSENEASADGAEVGPGIGGEVGGGDILDDEDSKEVEADSNEVREAEGVDS